MTDWQITENVARKVLETVDAGLVSGLGKPTPGQMCVEAAVCFAMDLPHGDDPPCVSRALRQLKISLNDRQWSSEDARSKGLRRLAVAQLGSRDHLDDVEFAKRLAELAIRTCAPSALRSAASIHHDPEHQQALLDAANKCECEATEKNAREARKTAAAAENAAFAAANAATAATAATAAESAAYAAATAADAAAYAANAADAADAAADARNKSLADFAEGVVKILIDMKAPGCVWLPLTEIAA